MKLAILKFHLIVHTLFLEVYIATRIKNNIQ